MSNDLPRHIAIIMDGNGRWAESRMLPRIMGHREGARNVRRLTTFCSDLGIEVLTLYAFSIENWTRPGREIQLLMKLIKIYATRERRLFMDNNVRMRVIGDLSKIPEPVRLELQKTIELTSKNTGLTLQLALSYGGRDEIVRATRKIARRVARGELSAEEISEDLMSSVLDTAGIPDPDLVIRTSGEIRISNYLLWQSAYAEYYFTEKFWPEFDDIELMKAIETYRKRDRRFGGVKPLLEGSA